MKLCWFHLMPYTDLPDDFVEKHESVWIDIDPKLFDAAKAHRMYNDFLDELEFAAEAGFDGICVNEHHSNAYGLMPSPNLIAAALARRTRDAALVVMGNSITLYNPPIRVAEELAMLDVISGGRVVAGFPVGTPFDTCHAYGQNPGMLRDRYAEAHDMILRCWTESAPFAFHGRFHQQPVVNPWPRPLQAPHPPIWIPGGGSVETWRWCAEQDYVYAYLSYFGYKAGEATMAGFWDEIDRLGKDRNPYRAAFLQFVGVAETEDEAMRLYREPADYFYNRCLHVHARWSNPPGYTTESTIRTKITSQVQLAAAESARRILETTDKPSFEEMVDKGYVLVGTPDRVAEKLQEVARTLNVGHLMLLFQFGNMRSDVVRYNTQLFAEHVAPRLRDLFDDEWEDRWWPRPLADDARARPRETRA